MSTICLVALGASALIEPQRGGRLASLRVDGKELLDQGIAPDGQPTGFYGGSFPMVPFAGFIPETRLRQFGATMAPNVVGGASHGLVYDRPWLVESVTHSAVTMRCDIAEGWPVGGEVRQRFTLSGDALTMQLSFAAAEPVPAALGFHPWFRRNLGSGPVQVLIAPERVRGFDQSGLAGAHLAEPPAHPWDHFVTGVRTPPVLLWPELALTLEADTPSWIVYEVPQDAVCIEPVTAAPSEVLDGHAGTSADEPLSLTLALRWTKRDATTPDLETS